MKTSLKDLWGEGVCVRVWEPGRSVVAWQARVLVFKRKKNLKREVECKLREFEETDGSSVVIENDVRSMLYGTWGELSLSFFFFLLHE